MYPESSNVIIAKVDATTNDVPDEIQGFPTIKLFPAGSKGSPIDYAGSRTIEDLAKFIKENGKYAYDAEVKNETGADADDSIIGKVAPAATDKAEEKVEEATEGVKEKVASAVSGAAEAVKTFVAEDEEVHDEL
jgi:protein disulfide-isomerase A1